MDTLAHPDESAASSTAADDAKSTEVATDGASSDVDPNTGIPFSEHPRWKEVYGSLKEYKGIGTTEQIRTALDRLAYYDNLVEQAQQAATVEAPSDEDKDLEVKRKQARKTLFEIAPELARATDVVRQLQEQTALQYRSLEVRANSELKGLMTKAGLPTEADHLISMAEHLVKIIGKDKELYAEYLGDPRAAVRTAWTRFIDDVAMPLSRSGRAATQQKGASLNALPKAGQGGGGTGAPGGKAAPTPQTINELFKQHKGFLTGKE